MASKAATQIAALIQNVQRTDPRLYELLRLIGDKVNNLSNDVFEVQASLAQTGLVEIPGTVTGFAYELRPTSVHLSWNRPETDVAYFRVKQGSVWETANIILTTKTLTADIEPLLVGTTRLLIKAVNIDGDESVSTAILDVVVPALGSISISSSVIDNNVLLRWSIPTSSFNISHYIVQKNSVAIGRVSGTFIAVFEQSSGSYTYTIIPYDIAGNAGPSSSIIAVVAQPPDYILKATFVDAFNGTRVNTIRTEDPCILASWVTETWQDHFTSRSWTTIQDQINAGYPLYIQPSNQTGSYEAFIDYGAIFSNVLIVLAYSTLPIFGTVNFTVSISISTDNISYSSPVFATTLFATSVRYVKVKFSFTAVA